LSGVGPSEDPSSSRKQSLLAIRLSPGLLARIDELYETIRDDVPWMSMTRSDLVRWILTAELEDRGSSPDTTP